MKNRRKIELFLFYITLLDILFIPYIKGVPIRPSMIVLVVWLMLGGFRKVFDKRRFFIFSTFTVLSIISIMLGSIIYENSFPVNSLIYYNLQTLVIVLFGILLLYYFQYIFKKYNPNVNKILITHLIFAFVFSVIYWLNPQTFWNIRSFWTISGDTTEFGSVLIERFPHVFSEPNNFSVSTTVLMSYLIIQKDIKYKVPLFFISTFVIFSSLSITGFILYLYSVAIILLVTIKNKNGKFIFKLSSRAIITTIVSLIFILLIYSFLLRDFSNNILHNLTNRISIYMSNDNISGSRFEIWINYIKDSKLYFNFIVGKGGVIINRSIGKPHNGHLYLISHFGLISYIIFVSVFFKKRKEYSWTYYFLIIVPFLLIFTFNTLITDLRSFYLFVIIISSVVLSNNKRYFKKGEAHAKHNI